MFATREIIIIFICHNYGSILSAPLEWWSTSFSFCSKHWQQEMSGARHLHFIRYVVCITFSSPVDSVRQVRLWLAGFNLILIWNTSKYSSVLRLGSNCTWSTVLYLFYIWININKKIFTHNIYLKFLKILQVSDWIQKSIRIMFDHNI